MGLMTLDVKFPHVELNKYTSRLGHIVGKQNLQRVSNEAALEVAERLREQLEEATPENNNPGRDESKQHTRALWTLEKTTEGYRVYNRNPLPVVEWLINSNLTLKSDYWIHPHGPYQLKFYDGDTFVRRWRVHRTQPSRINEELRDTWNNARSHTTMSTIELRDFIRSRLEA